MIFNPNSGFSGGGLEGLRVEARYGTVNSSGEFLLTDSMTESEFKEKFIMYFATGQKTGDVPQGDRSQYKYYNSSQLEHVADNSDFQAFRFSGTEVYCSCYPLAVSPNQYLQMVLIYKDV